MRALIVNADDFGLTRGVSAGILAAYRHGIVTSTTVLVTAKIDRRQLDEARDTGLGLGLHVNLTLGTPSVRLDRKSTRLNSSHVTTSRMPSSA